MALPFGDIFTNILILVFSLTVIAVVYVQWCFTYWKRKGVQTHPTFLFGNVKNSLFRKSVLGPFVKDAYLQFKSTKSKYAGMYFFTKPIFIPIELELIKSIMSKDFEHFVNRATYVNEKVDPLSGHLVNLTGLKWKNLRAKLTPTFTSGKMKMMFQTLVNCSDGLVDVMDKSLQNREAIDIKDVVARFTTDVIGSCAFGIDCNSLKNPNSEFREYGRKVFEPNNSRAIIYLVSFLFPEILKLLKIPLIRKDVSKFFMNVVDGTVKYREENNIVRKDFMHLLIQLKNNINLSDEDLNQLKQSTDSDNVGKLLTMPEVAAQAFVFFLAGFETSSTTLTFCLYELVKNIDIQDKLRGEISSVLEKYDGKLTYDAIMEMSYMEKCINETLRKYPPFPIVTRECITDYKVPDSDLIIEKGTAVFISIWGIHYDTEHYPNPDQFDPERFSTENKFKRHAFTWLPFGEGPRTCIGLRFAMMETKVALAVLLKNYKFTLNFKTEQPLVFDPKVIVLTARNGVWLNAEKIVT